MFAAVIALCFPPLHWLLAAPAILPQPVHFEAASRALTATCALSATFDTTPRDELRQDLSAHASQWVATNPLQRLLDPSH